MESSQEKAEVGGRDGGWQWPSDSAPEGSMGVSGGWRVVVEVVEELVGGGRDILWMDPVGMVCWSKVWEIARREWRW